jgi:hypothetical protein
MSKGQPEKQKYMDLGIDDDGNIIIDFGVKQIVLSREVAVHMARNILKHAGAEEPDSQQDATADQVKEWMRKHMLEYDSREALARAAHEHFARPFHINVLTDMAEKIYG